MASLDILDFGLVMKCETVAHPKARQVSEYPGADGLQSRDLGARGGRTVIDGVLSAFDRPSLAAVVAQVRAYQLDGGAYTFVDNDGVAWPDVILAEFHPEGLLHVIATPSGPQAARRYRAVLLHLS